MRKAERKIELLAPAGNMDALKAAVAGGCDAVYLGGTLFSARAFAGNFNHEELIEAVRYCHVRGVCVYVTLNTLLFETEVENAMKEVEFLYEHDVDALLVQELGLFRLVRQCFPDFPVIGINDRTIAVEPLALRIFPEIVGYFGQCAGLVNIIGIEPGGDFTGGQIHAVVDGVERAAVLARNHLALLTQTYRRLCV